MGQFLFQECCVATGDGTSQKKARGVLEIPHTWTWTHVGNVELRYFPATIFPHGCPGGCCSDVQWPAGIWAPHQQYRIIWPDQRGRQDYPEKQEKEENIGQKKIKQVWRRKKPGKGAVGSPLRPNLKFKLSGLLHPKDLPHEDNALLKATTFLMLPNFL